MISPLLQDTFGRIAENLLAAFVNDKIKNPYVAATIAPLVSTFVGTILTGNATQTVSTPPNTVDPSFWDQATRQYQEVNP